ncbi:hypothetical protein D1871_21435, partial [Nakamurella silvestris]
MGGSLALAVGGATVVAAPAATAAIAAAPTTAWQNGSFHLDPLAVASRANLILGRPNTDPTASMPMGNGSLGVSAWSASGFTAQLNRSDTMPARKSPGQINIPGLSVITNAADYTGSLDVTTGVFTESGAGMTAKVWVAGGTDELVVDVTGANPALTQTATLNLWSGRTPTATVTGTVGTLAETWVDGQSGKTFGSLAGITAGGRNVATTVASTTQIKTTFTPNADGSFRVVVASPGWNGTQGNAGALATTTIGADATAARTDLLAAQGIWWKTYWNQTGVVKTSSADGNADYLENLRTLYLYEARASFKPGYLPGSQAGEADMFAWAQDKQTWDPASFWLWNLRGSIAAHISSGAYELNIPIFDLYINNLSNIQAWTTAQMGGRPGICLPETMRFNGNGGDPGKGVNSSCSEPSAPNWNALNITSGPEVAMYIWQQYQATGDLSLLTRAFPFMRASAQFLLAYQQVGADGWLHSNANAHETQWSVQDPTTNMAASAALFPVIGKVAALVGVDAGTDPLLGQIAAAIPKIPPYPRTDQATRTALLNPDYSQAATAAADATGTDMIAISYEPAATRRNGENVELEPLWPWNQISDQDPVLFAVAQRSYTSRPNKGGNDWSLDAVHAARLQQPAEVATWLINNTKGHQVYPNGFADIGATVGYQPYLEQTSTVTAAMNEALAQDFDGILRFAPAWPTGWDVSGTVYIQHNSKVDVQVQGGQLTTAAIEAGFTGTQKVKNPWPGKAIQVVSGTDGAVVVPSTSDALIDVPVTSGRSYLVEQVATPTSSFTYAPVTGTAPTAARHLGNLVLGLDVATATGTAVVGTVLGTTNISYGLKHVETTDAGFDGPTTAGTVGGRTARTATNSNLYFDVDDAVAKTGNYTAVVVVSYYDQGTGTVSLQYDDGNDAYRGAGNFTLTGTNTWKTATITAPGAYFSGAEHSGADFRLRNNNGPTVIVHSVGVTVTGTTVPNQISFPPVPVVTAPTAGQTIKTTGALTGTGEPGGTLTVKDGSTTLCTLQIPDNGSWTCTPSAALSTGKHTATVSVTDPTGLASAASPALSFNASDSPAGTAVVGSVVGSTNYSYGMSQDERPSSGFDGPTTAGVVGGLSARTTTQGNMYFDIDDTVAHSGSFQASFTISYYDQGTGSIAVQYDDGTTDPYKGGTPTVQLTGTNTWKTATVKTLAATDAAFGGGQHSAADFRLRNSNGQLTVHSIAVSVTGFGVPNTAPFAPTPAITAPATGTTSTSGLPVVSGTAEPAASVTLSDNGSGSPVTVCTATADAAGVWSCTPTTALAGGAHSLTATATDPTSTPSGTSAAVVVTVAVVVDTTAPVSTVTLAPGAPQGTNGWYTTAVTATLAATDAGSGVAKTEFSLDGGAWTTYTAAVAVSGSGVHSIA